VLLPSDIRAAIQFDATPYVIGKSSGTVRAVVSADLDNDGDLDLVTGNNVGEVTAWLNDGNPYDGAWIPHAVNRPSTDAAAPPVGDLHLDAADFDNDGWVDLVAGDAAGRILVYRNDGTPFNGPWPSSFVASVTSSAVVRAVDLDSDSWMDIACVGIAYGGPGDVTIWRNDGTPFQGAWSGSVLFSEYTLGGIAIADLDVDGNQDIVFTWAEYFAGALRNDGTPFDGGWTYSFVGMAGYGMVTGLAPADFDLDGYPDLATACGYLPTQPQWVWRNDHTPFDPWGGWDGNDYGSTPAPTVAAADLDLDGLVDLVTGSHAVEDFEVIAWGNDGTPFTGPWSQVDVGSTGDAGVQAIALADLDGDGFPEIVSGSTHEANYEILVWRNLSARTAHTAVEDAVSAASGTTADRIGAALHSASPNPFVRETTMLFDVPSHVGQVSLGVYTVRGQLVKRLIGESVGRGRYAARWDGTDGSGMAAASGMYLLRLEVGEEVRTQKVLLMR
jgi:hypothetical protein